MLALNGERHHLLEWKKQREHDNVDVIYLGAQLRKRARRGEHLPRRSRAQAIIANQSVTLSPAYSYVCA